MLREALTLAFMAGMALAPRPAPGGPTWKPLDPENTLVIDTTKGRIVIEMQPVFAPLSVERVKRLAHEHFYDGLAFWRVLDGFMAQTGDPGNVDGGKSPLPNLKPEFTFRHDPLDPVAIAARPTGLAYGFIGAVPFVSQRDGRVRPDHKVTAWGLYCPGVAGMGRDEPPDSGNSEFFLMRNAYPSLDAQYSVWGRIVSGLEVVRALKTGEPVKDPDLMTRVRVDADLPDADRPKLEVMDTRSMAFRRIVERVRKREGADFSACDVEIPVRKAGR
ncbi:MAG TPA: peptidylprolyl isomerase [Caulobacteraceae bacterium]|jgi:peptidylprolyl isomerase